MYRMPLQHIDRAVMPLTSFGRLWEHQGACESFFCHVDIMCVGGKALSPTGDVCAAACSRRRHKRPLVFFTILTAPTLTIRK